MSSTQHLQRRLDELRQQYELLSGKISRIRTDLAIETSAASKFQLEKQLEQTEGERGVVLQQIELLEGQLKGAPSELEVLLRDYLQHVVADLEEKQARFPHDLQRNILGFYIEPKGANSPTSDGNSQTPHDVDVWELIAPSLKEAKPCMILAEFGMGKTWLLETIRYRLAKRALSAPLSGGDSRIPLLVKLRDFRQEGAPAGLAGMLGMVFGGRPSSVFEQLREQAWKAAFGDTATANHRASLLQLFEKGRFLFLFDALDEVALGSKEDMSLVLTEIGKISSHTKRSPLIITCRRSFFRDPSQERGLRDRGFEVFYLSPWSRDDLLQYLEKAHAAGLLKMAAPKAIKRIEAVHDLRDIASRALLSAMLVDQWEAFMQDEAVDVPSLYERYIEKAILSWQSEKSWQVEMHELQRYMEELAFLMFRLNTLSISPAELDEYFSGKFSEFGISKFSRIAESLVRDVKTNSFLLREDSNYVFCHASVWEFLVARKLVGALERRDPAAFRITSRASQYRSIMNNFLLPMLLKKGQDDLISALMNAEEQTRGG